ncbi:MAG: hypothetical protein LBK61_14255 [Spirochaetaceae bacterium]|nr:hypothetical protein [Spirochaetaceae bacterium]
MATGIMTAPENTEAGKSHSFEQVWATMDRLAAEAAERKMEFDREAAERKMEADERQKKAEKEYKELRRSIDATNRQIGKLGGRYGEMVECMVLPNLVSKFRKQGFEVGRACRGATIQDRVNGIAAEIDIMLENGGKVIIVEVKSKPTPDDVNDHIRRMEKVRRHADLNGDRRVFLGAVAGMVMNDDMRDCILGHGFYAIEPSGDTFNITVPEKEYRLREWHPVSV